MSNVLWATKYRPRKFSDIKGQPDLAFIRHMLRGVKVVPPLMLFCGPSGVGKTTAARIVAASLNCDTPTGEEPCLECPACVSIFNMVYPAVTELDAASQGKAEDMRRLREDSYSYTTGKVRVFIIDEAQSISGQGWNVLLKTFEEPPENVSFILLTSEPMKVPTKIRTRAVRFDFGRVSAGKVLSRLESICDSEGVEITDDIDLSLITDLADGSVREAIMLLQQVVQSERPTEAVLGNRDNSFAIIRAALLNNRAEGLKLLSDSYNKTGDVKGIIELWGSALEKVLFYNYDLPVFVSKKREATLRELASGFDDVKWASAMETLADWAPRATSRSHLPFVWASFLKAIHGSALLAQIQTENVKKDEFRAGELEAVLKGLDFDE
jgi:DNA polymerase-3 subunit gamma/tau